LNSRKGRQNSRKIIKTRTEMLKKSYFGTEGVQISYSPSLIKALGKLGNIVAETLFPTNVSLCFPEWANTRKH
jgi:hypothetical protein